MRRGIQGLREGDGLGVSSIRCEYDNAAAVFSPRVTWPTGLELSIFIRLCGLLSGAHLDCILSHPIRPSFADTWNSHTTVTPSSLGGH